MSRIIKSFEEFHKLTEQSRLEENEQLDEGLFTALATKFKNGLSRMLGGRIAQLDRIYGSFSNNGKMVGIPNGELGKLEYDYITSNIHLDEEILKKKSTRSQFNNSKDNVPEEALIANQEFMKRIEQLRVANKKRYDARKAAIEDKIERIVGDKQRAAVYSEALASQLNAAIAETEYNLRKKFASDEELEKLEDKLVEARKDAVARVARLETMLKDTGLSNSQVSNAKPVQSANGRQTTGTTVNNTGSFSNKTTSPVNLTNHKFVP